MENKQKILNEAFYATLFMVGISVLFVFLGIAQLKLTFLGVIAFIVFPVLGFFTKKSSLVAARLLLIVFLVDSVLWIINWLSYSLNPLSVYWNLFLRFVFWWTFYRAYKAIKLDKK